MSNKNTRVVVALSGGVDSSVAAYLLVKQGYDVVGIFMKNWHDDTVTISNECPWVEDSYDAMIVAEKLSIPFQTIDLSKEYQERIIDYMFTEYKIGNTPNPDILCNREIKFDVFLEIAKNLGADYVATGHYCRVVTENNQFKLLSGKDSNKDQSYFLCQLSQKQLSKVIFPIGELNKKEVRLIAKEQNLVTAEKKDSQGLCFVGKVKLPEFLQQKLKIKKGLVVKISNNNRQYIDTLDYNNHSVENLRKLAKPFDYSLKDGDVLGEHDGAHFFTVGQRKGLAIGGSKEPLFVIKTDVINNIVYVGEGKDHPGLYRKVLFIKNKDFHKVRTDFDYENVNNKFESRIRYRQPLQKSKLVFGESGVFMIFDNLQSAISKGQFAVWYKNEELIGSGVID
ncbi:tRNA 2-thiouridine(34) synthase MnmA [Flavobacteriaceae bacterium]|nr:tRNA 2-thiouridine(34) synthase MnmA [Flavobacteriaceae bacterium]MDB4093215.1 tRNA 2-thiouridine(34) synthase MnmA [Flavobacteriaceae bacterium]MDB9853296.1 tRNA 2-thiouridine(34) synthase MnmA [Flavobacteriaceae bacterium]MDB9994711.1 tRNA 2-thiouridine(34) synthase MnmA [Flavobacteriaceae bacterium]|tara:strand:+ start:5780 stop:6964 length:1185 start_codon:yes stop_codon:yes gene_type:complete